MSTVLRKVSFVAALVAGLFASAASAVEYPPIEEAIEASRVELFGKSGSEIRVVPCPGCESKIMTLDSAVQVIRDGRQVPFQTLVRHSGGQGTVIYSLKTGKVVRVIVY